MKKLLTILALTGFLAGTSLAVFASPPAGKGEASGDNPATGHGQTKGDGNAKGLGGKDNAPGGGKPD